MPRSDGVDFIQKQMAIHPIPIVVVSIAAESSEQVLNALDAGAVDFVQKPTALATEKIFEIAEDLVAKVRAAAGRIGRTASPGRAARQSPAAAQRTFATDTTSSSSACPPAGRRDLRTLIPRLAGRLPGARRDCLAHANRLYRGLRQAARRCVGVDGDRSARRRPRAAWRGACRARRAVTSRSRGTRPAPLRTRLDISPLDTAASPVR